jgi:Pectate lyase superfamily protein
MKKILIAIAICYGSSATCQNPPQKINANYQYQGVGGDSTVRAPKSKPSNIVFRDTGAIFYNKADEKIHWFYNLTNDTTFQPGPGNVFHYNVLNFGAVRDSTISNTTAIQTAIDSAHVTGGTVYIPAGIWLTGQIQSYSNVYIYGEDQGTIIKTTALDTAIIIRSNTFQTFNVLQGYAPISNISINCQNACKVGISAELLYWFHWHDINIMNPTFAQLYLKGTLTGQFENMLLWGGSYGVFADSLLSGSGQVSPNLLDFINVRFYHHPIWGMKVNLGQGLIKCDNCDFEDNGTAHTYNAGAIFINHPSANGPALLLENTWFEDNLGTLMRVDSGTSMEQVSLIDVNAFQNTGASVGFYFTNPSHAGNYATLVGTTLVSDSVDVLMDGNGMLTSIGSNIGTNNLGILANYLIKKYPTEQQLVSLVTTSGPGVVTPGAGAGAGATATLSSISNSGGGTITVTTGLLPVASSVVATIALEIGAGFSLGDNIALSAGNANASQALSLGVFSNGSTTFPYTLTISNGSTALQPSTVYIFNYIIGGK